MIPSQIRAEARKRLASKWGKGALTTILLLIAIYTISRVLNFNRILNFAIFMLFSIPLIYGFAHSMFQLNDDLPFACWDFLKYGFVHFTKIWSIALHIASKLILPISFILVSLLLSAYGIAKGYGLLRLSSFIFYVANIVYLLIKQLSYQLAIFISFDNPDMTGKEVVQKSEELMKGNVKSLLCFDLSFASWVILTIFTLGLGLLWLIPYKIVSDIHFYRNLTGEIIVKEK